MQQLIEKLSRMGAIRIRWLLVASHGNALSASHVLLIASRQQMSCRRLLVFACCRGTIPLDQPFSARVCSTYLLAFIGMAAQSLSVLDVFQQGSKHEETSPNEVEI